MQRVSHSTSQRGSLLSRVNWRGLSRQAAKELSNREIHAPVVSTYRWWARRPHSVIGAILDAAVERYGDGLTVADPFSGGGTVTFEAARRGLKAYAQDLYPWPARGLACALSPCTEEELEAAAVSILEELATLRAAYRTSSGAELSHVLRVRMAACESCNKDVFEFPHAMVSVASRSPSNRHAFFGCRYCGTVSLRKRDVGSFKCDGCARRSSTSDARGCPHCAGEGLRPHSWHAVLVQELDSTGKRPRAVLRKVRQGDPVHVQTATHTCEVLARPIPTGKETKRLLTSGFAHWGDLYTDRQANALREGLAAISRLNAKASVKDRLAFCLLGAAEMPAFLSRWDRFHLKPFEATANHRYAQTSLVVESNPLSPVGRGTVPNRLKAAAGAVAWMFDAQERPPRVVTATAGQQGRKRTEWDVLVTTGSSVKQELRDSSVNVVLTDPPYFDDVQYGELARLFHVWLSLYDPNVVVNEDAEAVPNAFRGKTATDYQAVIAACLRESRRTLAAHGTLVLTFHNTKLAAWQALTGAVATAGFQVTSLAAVLAENSADHCKRNVKAMLHDLVIECVDGTRGRERQARLQFRPRTEAEKNLAAIGLALAHCVRKNTPGELEAAYRKNLEAIGGKSRLIE